MHKSLLSRGKVKARDARTCNFALKISAWHRKFFLKSVVRKSATEFQFS